MAPEKDLPPALAAAVERLDALIQRFEQHPEPAVQQRVFELLQCVDFVHRTGLQQLAALLRDADLLPRALDDTAVRLLFELYGLVGDAERTDAVPAAPAAGFVPLASVKVVRRVRENPGLTLSVAGAGDEA